MVVEHPCRPNRARHILQLTSILTHTINQISFYYSLKTSQLGPFLLGKTGSTVGLRLRRGNDEYEVQV